MEHHITKRLAALGLVLILLVAAALGWCIATGKSVFVGRYLQARDGSHMAIDSTGSPVILEAPDSFPRMFDPLEDGDRVLVVCGGINTSYPGRSGAYWCLRLGGGSMEDLPKDTINQLTQLGWLTDRLS